jgi:hypothetical protein
MSHVRQDVTYKICGYTSCHSHSHSHSHSLCEALVNPQTSLAAFGLDAYPVRSSNSTDVLPKLQSLLHLLWTCFPQDTVRGPASPAFYKSNLFLALTG